MEEITQLKKYRLGYDYLFLANMPIKHKEDFVTGVALYLIIKVTDKKGKEIIFESNDFEDQSLFSENGDKFYLSDLIVCRFDRKKLYDFEVNIPLFRESGLASIQWDIDHYSKDIQTKKELFSLPVYDVVKISESEFTDILRSNIDLFDNNDNYSTQTTTYIIKEVFNNEKIAE